MREENRSLFFFAPFPPSQFRLSLAPTICPWVSKEACKRPPFVSDRDKTATTFSGHFLISELAVCTRNEKRETASKKISFKKYVAASTQKWFPCGSTLVSDKQILLVAYRRFNCSQYRGSFCLAIRPFVLIGYLLKANYQCYTQKCFETKTKCKLRRISPKSLYSLLNPHCQSLLPFRHLGDVPFQVPFSMQVMVS